MADAPWYHEGLKFTCTQCGDCCTGAPGVVWVTDEEIQKISELTGLTLGELRIFHLRNVGGRVSLREFPNGDCTFLDASRKCTIYSARPAQCRTWPFWNSNLESPESWQQVEQVCPGAGCGRLYSLDEITVLKEVVDI